MYRVRTAVGNSVTERTDFDVLSSAELHTATIFALPGHCNVFFASLSLYILYTYIRACIRTYTNIYRYVCCVHVHIQHNTFSPSPLLSVPSSSPLSCPSSSLLPPKSTWSVDGLGLWATWPLAIVLNHTFAPPAFGTCTIGSL